MEYEMKKMIYIFLDVVAFTINRSNQEQSEIIQHLYLIVKKAVEKQKLKDVAYLPTGDGICIAFEELQSDGKYDAYMYIALDVLKDLSLYNKKFAGTDKEYKLRIGINSACDIIIDKNASINNMRNFVGNGINVAQRVMSAAGPNQLFVGPDIYNTLGPQKEYKRAFEACKYKDKHGKDVNPYQYIKESDGLCTGFPKHLIKSESILFEPERDLEGWGRDIWQGKWKGEGKDINVTVDDSNTDFNYDPNLKNKMEFELKYKTGNYFKLHGSVNFSIDNVEYIGEISVGKGYVPLHYITNPIVLSVIFKLDFTSENLLGSFFYSDCVGRFKMDIIHQKINGYLLSLRTLDPAAKFAFINLKLNLNKVA